MDRKDILNRAKMYQDMVSNSKQTYFRNVVNGATIHKIHEQMQLPLGFIWLALRLLERDAVEDANVQLDKARLYVISLSKWVGQEIKNQERFSLIS